MTLVDFFFFFLVSDGEIWNAKMYDIADSDWLGVLRRFTFSPTLMCTFFSYAFPKLTCGQEKILRTDGYGQLLYRSPCENVLMILYENITEANLLKEKSNSINACTMDDTVFVFWCSFVLSINIVQQHGSNIRYPLYVN